MEDGISVIVASKNAKHDLMSTIESLEKQKDKNFEFILIDGASSDGTIDAVYQMIDDFVTAPIIVSEPDKGIYDAYNKGLSLASNGYICYLGCGDKLLPNSIETVRDVMAHTPNSDVYYGIIKRYDKNGAFTIYSSSPENLLDCSMIPHQACFVRKEAYLKYGGFSLDYVIASDFAAMLQIYLNKGSFVFIDKILAEFKMGGISTRNSDGYYECIKILRKNGCISKNDYRKKRTKKYLRDLVSRIF